MIMHTRLLTLVTLIVVIAHFVTAQKLSKEQQDILQLQDSRSLGEGRLVSYLQNNDKYLRFRAAIALGNIQDTSTVSSLVPLLKDEDVRVRAAAAFALGQIGSPLAVQSLIGALTPDQDMQVLASVLEGLGKCGDARALQAVVGYIPPAKNIAIKRNQALSIAAFGIRKITSESGLLLCFDLLKDNHSETRSAALYALWKCAPTGLIDDGISNRAYLLVTLMRDEDADVRIDLAALLGKTKSEEGLRLIRMFQQVDQLSPDWRLEVEIVRSAAMLSRVQPGLLDIVLSSLDSPNDHVKMAALRSLVSLDTVAVASFGNRGEFLLKLKHLALHPSKDAILVQGEAMVALSNLFPNDFAEMEGSFRQNALNDLVRAKFIEALSIHPTQHSFQYVLNHVSDGSLNVAEAAWEFLRLMMEPATLKAAGIERSFVDSLYSPLVHQMEDGLRRNDVGITTLVAEMIADSNVLEMFRRPNFRDRIAADVRSAYSGLTSSSDVEPMIALQHLFVNLRDSSVVPDLERTLADSDRLVAEGSADALLKITGRDYSAMVHVIPPPLHTENDWKMLEAIRSGQRVLFKTTKGKFSIQLHKEDAPFTALAFYKLVKQKFFDGLTFHRVVPDFVVQGGDPRGDGWGGLGFTLRSEFSLDDFERGSVGMANSGKDTQGCQFFITHVPAPHLDGRYTLFGSVVSGMQVVDRLQVGDKILEATIE